jgi:hypothetical protein
VFENRVLRRLFKVKRDEITLCVQSAELQIFKGCGTYGYQWVLSLNSKILLSSNKKLDF